MKPTRLLLIGLLIAGSAAAEPLRLEVKAGLCTYLPSEQGEWWAGPSEMYVAPMQAPCYQLGLSRVVSKGIGWRVAYVDLGEAQLNEQAYGGPGVQPHWTAVGKGRTKGISFGGFIERRSGDFTPSVEAGLLAYRSQWEAAVYHHASGLVGDVQPSARSGVAPYIGAGLGFRFTENITLDASLRFYYGIKSNTLGANWDHIGPAKANVVAPSVGVTVNF